MVLIAVMGILVAASLPLWSQAIQRDKEEELIFRGLQYAEAIRLFKTRFQRPPVRLEELLEAKPRCIRQLWKDPMSVDGKWQVLYENVQQPPGRLTPQPPTGGRGGEGGGKRPPGKDTEAGGEEGSPGADGGGGEDPGGDEGEEDGGGFFPTTRQKEELTIGPIRGVRSRSDKESVLIWRGQQRYDQWEFTADLIQFPKLGDQGQLLGYESTRW